MTTARTTSVNLFGCLPLVLVLMLLGGMGFCGATCQSEVLGGVKAVRSAFAAGVQ